MDSRPSKLLDLYSAHFGALRQHFGQLKLFDWDISYVDLREIYLCLLFFYAWQKFNKKWAKCQGKLHSAPEFFLPTPPFALQTQQCQAKMIGMLPRVLVIRNICSSGEGFAQVLTCNGNTQGYFFVICFLGNCIKISSISPPFFISSSSSIPCT